MRDEKAKLKELSNNISDRNEAKGTGIMSDLLLANGEARQLVANPHYTILLTFVKTHSEKMKFINADQIRFRDYTLVSVDSENMKINIADQLCFIHLTFFSAHPDREHEKQQRRSTPVQRLDDREH